MLLSSKAALLYVWTIQNNKEWYNRLIKLAWYDENDELIRKASNYVRANNTINASEEEMRDAVEAVINYIRLVVKRDKEEVMSMWEKLKSCWED